MRLKRTPSSMTLVIGSVLGLLLVLTAGAGPASADPRLTVRLEAENASVPAGDLLVYNAFVQCSIPAGCAALTLTLTPPVGASGPALVSRPLPTGVTSVTVRPDGSVVVVFGAGLAAGQSRQLAVSWPTEDYYTVPGEQTPTLTATSSSAGSPSTDSATNRVVAAPHPEIVKTGATAVAAGNTVTYTIIARNQPTAPTRPTGDLVLVDATVVDTLPAGAVFVSASAGGVYNPTSRTVTWPIDTDATRPGSQFGAVEVYPRELRYTVTVRYPAGTAGTTQTNRASVTGTPLGSVRPITVTDDAVTRVLGGEGVPVLAARKFQDSTTMVDGQRFTYYVVVGNEDGTAPAAATVLDTVPAGFDPTEVFVVDYVSGLGYTLPGSVTVRYSNGSSRTWTMPGDGNTFNVARAGLDVVSIGAQLSSVGAGERIAVRIRGVGDLAEVPGGAGTAVTNCADVDLVGVPGQTPCATATLAANAPKPQIFKSAPPVPVSPGGTVTFQLRFVNVGSAGAGPFRPDAYDLLPPELSYLPDSFVLDAGQPAYCAAGGEWTVTQAADYLDGRDAVHLVAPASMAIPNRGGSCTYSIDTLVAPGTSSGAYDDAAANRLYSFDANTMLPATRGIPRDALDVDQDGSTTEGVVAAIAPFAVAESSEALVVKRVKGDRDTGFFGSAEVPGQEDQVGTSNVGGTVTWQVLLGNLGNKDLTHLVAYDLLPAPDTVGITDGRYSDVQVSQWRPVLTGPIPTGGAPVVVTYSTKADPCRPEMDNSGGAAPFYCAGVVDPSFVPAAGVTDWSAVRSVRFDFGDEVVSAGETYTFTFDMAVPTTEADGTLFEGGERTWNKVAIQADRLDSDGSLLPLLATEAPWVVDQVFIPYALGDYVWFDTDRDGVQDASERPVPGVTVRLLDSSGGAVVDADGDPVAPVSTDATGRYHFDNLLAGDYIVEFVAPDGTLFTTRTAGTDTTVDSDADPSTGRSAVITLGPGAVNVTVAVASDGVTAPYINRTIDAGLVVLPVRVGDFVWIDKDRDGVQDAGEPGIPGVTLVLRDAGGTAIGTTTTDADGRYLFDALPPGRYTVCVDSSTVPDGLVATKPGVGDRATDSSTGCATSEDLPPGAEDLTLDFGFVTPLEPGPPSPRPSVSVKGVTITKGNLPHTGGEVGGLLALGFGLLASGAAVLLGSRRRGRREA